MSEDYLALLDRIRAKTAVMPREGLALGLTCCISGEGVTTIATNIALAAAMQDQGRVVVVDAHFARPRAARLLEAPEGAGLADVLEENADLEDCLQPADTSPLIDVLSAGTAASRRTAKLTTVTARSILDDLQRKYSLVIWDLPPAGCLSHTLAVAPSLHGVILVVEAERVKRQVVQSVKEQLQECDVNLYGVVLNKRRHHLPGWLYRRL